MILRENLLYGNFVALYHSHKLFHLDEQFHLLLELCVRNIGIRSERAEMLFRVKSRLRCTYDKEARCLGYIVIICCFSNCFSP